MIARYTRPEMGAIWSEETKYRRWLDVELAASEALAAAGAVPQEAARDLRAHARTDAARIAEIENAVRHDVIAFTTCVAESMAAAGAAESSRWFHYGLTSNDVVDTAQALQIRDATAVLRRKLDGLLDVLRERAYEFKDAVQIGRTHGVHAEPITFGLKIALWYDELRRNSRRLDAAAEELRVGKISGAVGTFGHIDPAAEERICKQLGLEPAAIASQVISRDRHAAFLAVLALVAATCEKIALEIRHLQRTEVREAEEPFGQLQKGSSAMPHKKNPVTAEQICGLARVVRGNIQPAFEDIALWHERDISHSSVERIILPDCCILVDYLLEKTTWLVQGMRVDTARMRRNLDATRGLVFSGQLLLDLTSRGVLREHAYKVVQRHAMASWETGSDFRQAVESDPELVSYVDKELLDQTFDVDRQLQHIDRIFQRVFH